MLEHDQAISIAADNAKVWDYVSDMSNWASAMPGYQSFEMLEGRDSKWVLKVGAGALTRTVKVNVHIQAWDEPDHVAFTYNLDNDPVTGDGEYQAMRRADGGTDIALKVRINGQGPMAPVWETLARPLLPALAQGFAETLKAQIEAGAAAPKPAGVLAKIWGWLKSVFAAKPIQKAEKI